MHSKISDLSHEYLQGDKKYEKDVTLFIRYIQKIGKEDKPTDITKEDITDSVRFYNKLKKIGTKNTLLRYISGIKAFYKYLVDNRLQEDIFARYHITSIGDYIEEICKDKSIDFKPISPREPFLGEVVIDILEKLDEYNYEELKQKSKQARDWYYKYKMLRIFVKIMLAMPVKKSKITSLLLGDIDLNNRVIILNNYMIDIPCGLFRDLKDYILVRNEYNVENSITDDYLFMHSAKTQKITDTDINWWFGEFLNENDIIEIKPQKYRKYDSYRYSFSIEPLMNAALYNMLTNKTSLGIVAKINDCSVAQLVEKFGIQMNEDDEANKIINNVIKRNFYYKYI